MERVCHRKNTKRVYAVRQHCGKTMYLHRFIMCPEDGFDVDHISGDCLDNRVENLRICTRKQNLANNRSARGIVGFRGVTLDNRHERRDRPFLARVSGKNVGRYATAEEAARAYDFHAKLVYGEYAKMNF